MSTVIDSLKRLERAGSETSKTTQKLIAAAKTVEASIVAKYRANQNWTIYWRGGIRFELKGDELTLNGISVSANRAAALKFAAAIADGLLKAIETRWAKVC